MSEHETELRVWPVGAMALVKPMLDLLGFAQIVDETCPMAEQGDLSHGQVAEALVCNRFTSPMPFYRVKEWAEERRSDLVLKILPEKLYDNRLGRALDAMFPHLSTLKGKVTLRAIRLFDLDLSKLHHDAMSVRFYGVYEPTPEKGQGLRIVRGRPNDKLPGLKKLRLALITLNDGGVPLWPYVADGDAHASTFTIPHLEELLGHIQVKDMVVIHDREAFSEANICALERHRLGYVIAVPFNRFLKEAYPSVQAMKAKVIEEVPYVSGRDAAKPPEQRARYYVWREEISFRDPETGETYYAIRLYIRNTAKMHHDRAQRQKHIAAVQKELDRIAGLLNRYDYTVANRDQVWKRIQRVLRRAGGRYFTVHLTVEGEGEAARLAMQVDLDRRRIAQDGRLDGLHILQTNLLGKGYSLLEVLTTYKEQYHAEFSFRDLQGPMAVSPVFLHTPERIQVLLFLIVVALMIYVLLAREVRRALAGTAFLDWPRVTARRVVEAFHSLALVGERIADGRWHLRLTTLTHAQRELLRLLKFSEPGTYVHTGLVALMPAGP
jgi:transposase